MFSNNNLKKKRYLIFKYGNYDANGRMEDLVATFDSLEEVREYINDLTFSCCDAYPVIEVFDLDVFDMVELPEIKAKIDAYEEKESRY